MRGTASFIGEVNKLRAENKELKAEVARLRKVEEAAREVVEDWYGQMSPDGRLTDLYVSMPILRAALDRKETA